MNENFRGTIGIGHDDTGPSRLTAWAAKKLTSSAVRLTRQKVANAQARDPHRSVRAQQNILSTFEVEWDWPVSSSLDYLQLALEGMADAGRGSLITGGQQWAIGRGKEPVRQHIYLDTVDVAHYEALRCLMLDWTLNIDTAGQIMSMVTFLVRELSLVDSSPELQPVPPSGRIASGLSATVTLAGGTVFSFSVGFQRSVKAAGLDESSVAAAWDGRLVPDIGGKLTCRTTTEDFDSALTSELETALALSVALAGGATLNLSFPHCILQATSKQVIADGQFEYAFEWAAVQPDGDDLCTAQLLTA